MKCQSCDQILTDREATRRSLITGDYLDLCDHCFETIKDDLLTTETDDYVELFDTDAQAN